MNNRYEKLDQFLEDAFYGTPNTISANETKIEMAQNLHQQYDELLEEGKGEEEALRITCESLGNLSEIFGDSSHRVNDFSSLSSTKERSKPKASYTLFHRLLLVCSLLCCILCWMPTALFALAGYSESWIAAPVLLLCGLGVLGFIYSPAMRTDKTPSQKLRRFLIGLGVALEIVCAVPVLFSSNAYGVIVLLLLLSLGIICILIGAFIPQSSTEPSHTNQKVEKSPAHKLLWLITVIFYLLLSFLTQAWFITWILFLIAACISILLDAIQEKRE